MDGGLYYLMTPRSIGIVGAGPAGISAAVQLVRSGLPVTLFEGQRPGGLIRNAWRVENLVVHRPVSGPMLADILAGRALDSGAELVREAVCQVEYEARNDRFAVCTQTSTRRFHTLILATGTRPGPWPLLGCLDASLRARVHREVAELEPSGQNWVVVGGGDAAFDYALSLSEGGGRVWLLVRGQRPSALDRLVQAVYQQGDLIRVWTDTEVKSVCVGKNAPLRLGLGTPTGDSSLDVDGLVVAVGRRPALPPLGPVLEEKRVRLEEEHRFWIIGDACDVGRRQVGIALGSGLEAAMAIAEGRTTVNKGIT